MVHAAVTIADVAARAGVSTATVSRVLAGSDRVLAGTRARVDAAIADLDYRPSQVARSLRRQTTATLGLIVTDITNPFYPELVRGVEDAARRQGRSVVLCNAAEDPSRESDYLDLMLERRIDAVIVASVGVARRQAARLAAFPVPVVLANIASPDGVTPAVTSADHEGGRLAARHLIACGHTRLVHLAGPSEAGEISERLAGVVEVVDATPGVELEVLPVDGHLEGAARLFESLGDDLLAPVGIVAHNDVSAIGAAAVLCRQGCRIPDEVGLVGFDDIPMSAYVTPSLTTVAQDKYGMGTWAAHAVERMLAGEDVQGTTTLPVELVVRDSTGPVDG